MSTHEYSINVVVFVIYLNWSARELGKGGCDGACAAQIRPIRDANKELFTCKSIQLF